MGDTFEDGLKAAASLGEASEKTEAFNLLLDDAFARKSAVDLRAFVDASACLHVFLPCRPCRHSQSNCFARHSLSSDCRGDAALCVARASVRVCEIAVGFGIASLLLARVLDAHSKFSANCAFVCRTELPESDSELMRSVAEYALDAGVLLPCRLLCLLLQLLVVARLATADQRGFSL